MWIGTWAVKVILMWSQMEMGDMFFDDGEKATLIIK